MKHHPVYSVVPTEGRWKRAPTKALLILLIFLNSGSLRAQHNTGNITGRVITEESQSQRILVHLLSEADLPVGDTYTDSHGNFLFSALPSGTFYLVIEQEGYKPVREIVRLEYPSTDPRAQVYINLEPLSKEPKSGGQIIEGSPASQEVSAKSPLRVFNPKSLREFEKGKEKEQKGDLEAAALHYQKALKRDAECYPALNNLGTIYLRQKQYAKAEEVFLRALKMNPEDSQPYINMGHLLYEEGRYPEAIRQFEQGLNRSPRSALGRFLLGCAYLRTGGMEKAAANLKEACTLDPSGMAPAHLQLANLYLKQGEKALARAELETYLRMNPSDPQAPVIKDLLVKLGSH